MICNSTCSSVCTPRKHMHIVDTILSINNFDGSIGSATVPSKCPCKRSFYSFNRILSRKKERCLLEDNQEKYQPFEDDLMHKLIQMEENTVLH
jgi:hypothetical protein